MNTNTSTEGNGRKELKVTKTNDAEKLIDNFFAKFKEEYGKYPNLSRKGHYDEDIEYVLSTHGIIFKASEQSVKTQSGDENESRQNFVSGINVLVNGKRDFVLEELARGAGLNIKLADLRKVKAKTDKIRKEDADQKREESKIEKDDMEK